MTDAPNVQVPSWTQGKGERWLRIFDFARHSIRHYRTTFKLTEGSDAYVLKDLAKFCRARPTDSVFHPDEKMTYVLIGRHEVYERIMQRLNLSPQQLADILAGPNPET